MAYKKLGPKKAGELVLTSYGDWKILRKDWDQKFRDAMTIYRSEAKQLLWPGSNKKRSNVKVQMAADHVDSAWPMMVYNLFFASGEDFFDVVTEGDPKDGREIQDRLFYDLNYPDNAGRTGLWELSEALWDFIYLGFGATDVVHSSKLNRTVVRRRDPYKIYVPVVEGGWYSGVPAWIYRNKLPLKHLKALRGQEGFTIPGDERLMQMAKGARGSEEEEMENEERSADQMSTEIAFMDENPHLLTVPTLMYQSEDHLIWVLAAGDGDQDHHVIMEEPNPLGMTTLSGAWYHPHRKGLTHLLAEEQNIARKATNFGLDYLSLTILPPRNNRSGAVGNQSNLFWFPGSISKSREDDMKPQQLGGVPRELMDVIGAADMRAQRRSGQNSSHLMGVMPPSNANRTASGIQMTQAAANIRQFGPLWRADAGIIAPTLHKLHEANRRFDQRSLQQGMTSGQSQNGIRQIPRDKLDVKAQFIVQSANRTIGRFQVLQSLPLIMQHVFNPETIRAAAEAGMTLAWEELNELFHYATGLKRAFKLFVPMTPEQQQRKQSEQMAQKQLDAQTRLQIMQMKEAGAEKQEQSRRAGEADKTAADLVMALLNSGQVPETEEGEDNES